MSSKFKYYFELVVNQEDPDRLTPTDPAFECKNCKRIFKKKTDKCPNCGSKDWKIIPPRAKEEDFKAQQTTGQADIPFAKDEEERNAHKLPVG